MAFTTSDRDRIRDYFGYSWTDNDALTNHLADVSAEFGADGVETYVQSRLDALDTLQTTIDSAVQSQASYIRRVDIEGQASVSYGQAGDQLKGYAARRNQLIMEISRAINLQPNVGSAPLLRS